MNGKTKIDPLLNPCSAEMDKRTYGIPKLISFSTYGSRFICITFFGMFKFDFYRSALNKFGYWRIYNAGILFTPLGEISWPMPKLRRNK